MISFDEASSFIAADSKTMEARVVPGRTRVEATEAYLDFLLRVGKCKSRGEAERYLERNISLYDPVESVASPR